MATTAWHFRCKTNPDGPILTLTNFWEADEMRKNPDYERINELGEVVELEEAAAPGQIPFHAVGSKK